ncbi:MAG: ATP-binding protein [Balneolales bacterium]
MISVKTPLNNTVYSIAGVDRPNIMRHHDGLALENKKLKEQNAELEEFAHVVAHLIKSPLCGITSALKFVVDDAAETLDSQTVRLLKLIDASSNKLQKLVDGILEHNRITSVSSCNKETFNLHDLIKETADRLEYKENAVITYPSSRHITANKKALEQILYILLANGIKYNDKQNMKIDVGFSETGSSYVFSVRDNGAGIREEYLKKIFTMLVVIAPSDRFGNQGAGIGLATLKKLVEAEGGQVKVESRPGSGTRFEFTIRKQREEPGIEA